MADEAPIVTESPTAAAPSASETAATPAVSEASPIAAPVPVVETAPVVEAPIATAPSATPAAPAANEPTSLLGEAAKPAPEPTPEATTEPTAAKPEDGTAKAEGEAPAVEAPPIEAPLPTYDVFTVPEGVELEDQQVDQFVGALGSFERTILTEKDPAKIHAAVQSFGQKLLDQYTEEASQLGDRVRQANAETFARTMENWKSEFFNDPEIGGNRKDTTLKNVGDVIKRFGGNPQQIAELRSIFSTTGAGNHTRVLGLFNNIAGFLGEGRAVGAEKPEPQAASRKDRRYGKGN